MHYQTDSGITWVNTLIPGWIEMSLLTRTFSARRLQYLRRVSTIMSPKQNKSRSSSRKSTNRSRKGRKAQCSRGSRSHSTWCCARKKAHTVLGSVACSLTSLRSSTMPGTVGSASARAVSLPSLFWMAPGLLSLSGLPSSDLLLFPFSYLLLIEGDGNYPLFSNRMKLSWVMLKIHCFKNIGIDFSASLDDQRGFKI